VKNFQEILVAWAKLASVGARPVAESVGIDRDFFARVLNKRRDLPHKYARALAEKFGLTPEGFVHRRVESNLCRHLEDLKAIETLGFEVRFLAQIKSNKEIKGGKSLQKYMFVCFCYKKTVRLSILRMATDKWHRLMEELNFPDLPIVEIDTLLMSELNNIDASFELAPWQDMNSVLPRTDKAYVSKWLQALLQKLISEQIDRSGRLSNSKRVDRKTTVLRLAEKHAAVCEWPEAAMNYGKAHFLSPLTQDFSPAMAVGKRADNSIVSVYIASITDKDTLTFEENFHTKVGHALIFFANPLNPISKYEVLFDGPMSYLIELALKKNLKRDDRICLSAKDVYFLDMGSKSNLALKRRRSNLN
jgi:hypothetical protein